jgi:glycosyltransferase involved in cell wall biosynthesis
MNKNGNRNAQPFVSIIMNCYNGQKYLREAIDSVYAQTYKNWGIIFWDNASTDKSAEIANSYDSKLRYFRGENTITLGAARNKALEKCDGDYIAFLDADDLWISEKLEIQMQTMKNKPESILYYSDGYNLYDKKKTKKKFSSHPNVNFYDGAIFNKLILSNFINWQTVLINKLLANDDLYFNETLTFAEDHEILLRLSLLGDVTFSPEPLIYYRIHENNLSHDYELILDESEKIFDLFRKEIEDLKINMNKTRGLLYGSIIIKLIKQKGDFIKYSKYLLKYPNIQNVIVYLLIKLNLTKLFSFAKIGNNLVSNSFKNN